MLLYKRTYINFVFWQMKNALAVVIRRTVLRITSANKKMIDD